MKIRTDFVTNSSSSSFIIRKSEKFKTLDDLFYYIQNLYRDYLDKLEKAKKFAEENGHEVIIKNGYPELSRRTFSKKLDDETESYYEFLFRMEDETGFNFFGYGFTLEEIQKFIEAKNYKEFIRLISRSRFERDDFIHDGFKDGLDPNELIGWYQGEIAPKEKIVDLLKDCFIIYDPEGSRYHFHEIADELGEICIGHCTHMG